MSLSGDAAREWRAERDAQERLRAPASNFGPGYEQFVPPAQEPKSSLRFTMFGDIETSPQKHYIVDGLLGEGEMSAFAGAPGSGKSVLAGDLSCHLSAGMDWVGHRVKCPLGVLYVAAERANLTKRRFAAWRKRHGIHVLPLAIVEGNVDFLHSRVDIEKVLTFAERLRKTSRIPLGLIVVDTVSRALAGGDENGPKDMGAFVANIAALQEASGAHVLLIHHIPQDGNNRLRGHGALLGAVDTLLAIEKTGETRLASVTKDNDGAEGATIGFRLESVELSVDEDGLATTAPVVVPTDEVQPTSKRKAWPKSLRIFKAALDAVLVDHGAKMHPFVDGPEVLTATRELVREEFMRRYPADERKTKSKAFERSERAAIADSLIAVRELGDEANIRNVMWLLAS